jgi:hypothetical protein
MRSAFAFGCCAVAFACRLSVPPEVAENSDVLLVEERAFAPGAFASSEEFRLGGRKVSQVERRGFGVGLRGGGMSTESASGGYSFQFEGQRGPLVGRCDTSDSGFEQELGKGVSLDFAKANLVCQCGSAATLRLADDDFQDYSGTLDLEDRSYKVSTTYEAVFPAGYTVSAEGPLAVVDNMNPGQRVWITRDWETERRDELSCLFASLFLYTPPAE